MQFTTVSIATMVAALLPSALANGNAHVKNNCGRTVYYQSNADNIVHTLAANGVYSEPMTRGGSYIRMGWYNTLSAPLTFEYTPSNGLVYYDLSNNAGNPFAYYRNEVVPSVSGCTIFNCAPNDAACYSNGANIKVGACTTSTDVTVTLCAA